MPVPTRPTKPSSGTNSFITNTVIDSTEMNDDFNTLYAGFAALDNSNIGAAADIDPSKIGDYSVSDTEFKTVSDPGSGGSLTPPTDLEGELAALRYVIERMAIGLDGSTHVKRNDGISNVNCSWLDYPARPVNLATNNSFEYKSSAVATDPPDGWDLHDDPASITLATTDDSEGGGLMVTILTNATTEGIKQTFANLKPSTRYLVSVRAKNTGGVKTARLVTTGSDSVSAFRDITLDTTSATFVSLRAIIQTDSTPTDIVVFLMGVEDAATVHFDQFSLQECSKEVSYPAEASYAVRSVKSTEQEFNAAAWVDVGLSCSVSAASSGRRIEACANISMWAAATSTVMIRIMQKVGGAAAAEVYRTMFGTADLANSGSVSLRYLNTSVTPNTVYIYTVEANMATGTAKMNLTPGTYALNSSLDVSVI